MLGVRIPPGPPFYCARIWLLGRLGRTLPHFTVQLGGAQPFLYPYGPIAQTGERLPCKQDVVGSTPAGSTIFACVAQLVERLFCKQRVGGSNPLAGSILARMMEWQTCLL